MENVQRNKTWQLVFLFRSMQFVFRFHVNILLHIDGIYNHFKWYITHTILLSLWQKGWFRGQEIFVTNTRHQLNCIEKSLKRSNHQRYKNSVAFADFIIGAFVLPIVLVQRYYAAKLQLGSTKTLSTPFFLYPSIRFEDPWWKPPFWFDDLGLNDDLIERKKVSFLSNYPELTQAVGVVLFTSLFASNFSLLFSSIDMFVGIKFPLKRFQNETYIKWSGRLGVLSGGVSK